MTLAATVVSPRSRGAARAVAGAVLGACALVYTSKACLQASGPSLADAFVVILLVGLGVWLHRAREAVVDLLCVVTHVLGVGLIVVLDLVTLDATVGAQVCFMLPIVSAGSLLRPAGAALITGVAVVGETVVVLTVLPLSQALTDLAFVSTILVVTAGTLARAGVLQDRLIAGLQHQAEIDSLTGLSTRRVLDQATDSAVAEANSRQGGGAAFLLIDVDHFKNVNDRYGHLAGDDALKHIAQVVQHLSRPGRDIVARMGGDEIAVLMPGCSYITAMVRAQALVEEIQRQPVRLPHGETLLLSISVGVAHAPEHATSTSGLYAAADAALYGVKRGGRGRAGGADVDQNTTAAPGDRSRPDRLM